MGGLAVLAQASVAGDDEQRVVDADAEAEHDRQVGAIDGTTMIVPKAPTTARPENTPRNAVPIGISIAITVPSTKTRTIIAAKMPTASLSLVLGAESCEPR